jgi:hypothetical protein
MAALRLGMLGELRGDLGTVDARRGDGVAGVPHPAHDLGGHHLVEHGDDLLGVLTVRAGHPPVFHLLPRALPDRGDIGGEAASRHNDPP